MVVLNLGEEEHDAVGGGGGDSSERGRGGGGGVTEREFSSSAVNPVCHSPISGAVCQEALEMTPLAALPQPPEEETVPADSKSREDDGESGDNVGGAENVCNNSTRNGCSGQGGASGGEDSGISARSGCAGSGGASGGEGSSGSARIGYAGSGGASVVKSSPNERTPLIQPDIRTR